MTKQLTHHEIVKKGGETTKSKGPQHYAMLGRLGGTPKAAQRDPDYYKKLSKLGVAARLKKL